MKRRENTIDFYGQDVGTRTIEVEFSVPNFGSGEETWYVPVTFLPKTSVAPKLEVTDANEGVVAIPTKRQNFALTKAAIQELIEAGKVTLDPDPKLRELIDEMIEKIPLHARVCRYLFEEREPRAQRELGNLLRLLEDHFVLWAPVRGAPQSHHFLRVSRQEIRPPEPIIVRRRWGKETVRTALGSRRIRAIAVGGWPRPTRGALDRLLKSFALRPIEGRIFEFEAKRATSSHIRFNAPSGFLVRNVRVGEIVPPSSPVGPSVRELDPHEEDVVIQGWDQNLAHVHLSRPHNPEQIYCRVTLGIRGGVTTLWMLATLFTAALLWVVHHHSRYGPLPVQDLRDQFEFAFRDIAKPRPHLQLSAENKQIVAAVLLVGPAAASAWSLRAEGGQLLRSALAGARVLLLISAAISIAAALALAGVLPNDSGRYVAVEIYAAASYFVATPMVAAWLLASRPTWDLFRSVLNTEPRNLLVIAGLGLVVMLTGMITALPGRAAGGIVVACAIALGVLAANSTAVPLSPRKFMLYRPLAGIGSLPLVLLAGGMLRFYTDRVPLETAQLSCLGVGFLIAGIALAGLVFRNE